MPAVATSRPYHHGNLRAELLDHAERALERGGTNALSLRELAREAGVSHAAPRRHFADRQALLDALAEAGFERLGAALAGAVAGAPEDFAERLIAVARVYVAFATEHAALLELMFAAKHGSGDASELREAGTRAFAAPLALVAEGQRTGDIVGGDLERVMLAAWAPIHGIATMASAGFLDDVDLMDTVGDLVRRLMLGLRPRR